MSVIDPGPCCIHHISCQWRERALKAEREADHWKANHADVVRKYRDLGERFNVDRRAAEEREKRLRAECERAVRLMEGSVPLMAAHTGLSILRAALGAPREGE